MAQRHKYGVACPSSKIIDTGKLLREYGFLPYDVHSMSLLDLRDSHAWKYDDIVWKKYGTI